MTKQRIPASKIFQQNFDKETLSWVNVESYNNYFFDVLYYMPIPSSTTK